MTWWAWVLVFVAVAVGGAAVLLVQLRSLWRQASALFAEIGTVSEQLTEVTARLEQVQPSGPGPDLAVFEDPAVLRRTVRRSR